MPTVKCEKCENEFWQEEKETVCIPCLDKEAKKKVEVVVKKK